MKYIILIVMIFLHIVDDFYLQGVLAKFKQKDWWKENYPQEIYKYDYIICLLIHSFSWTFVMMLPITIGLLFNLNYVDTDYFKYFLVMVLNIVVHSIIDHSKANLKRMNLTQDQLCHLVQIFGTWLATINLVR